MKACLDDKLRAAGIRVKKRWSRQRKWQILNRLNGKCIKCGKDAVGGAFCDQHSTANRDNARGHYERRKAEIGYGQSSRRRVPRKYFNKTLDGKKEPVAA